MHCLPHRIVPTEGKGDVADASTDFGARQVLLDPARGLNEGHRKVVVLFHSGCHRQHIRIKNDILCREPDLFGEKAVGSLADLNLAFQ